MTSYEAVRVRLDPSPRQERLMESHAGGARYAYNLMLTHVQRQLALGERPDWTMYAMRRWWNEWKDELAPWWRENSKEAYNSAFEWLSRALRNWSDSRKGSRAGRRVGWPKYKSKRSSVPRFAYTTGSFGLIDGDPKALRMPRIGRVHCMENVARRVHGGRVVRMTVSRHAGFWYASLTIERQSAGTRPKTGKRESANHPVGVDLGVRTLATLSDGTTFPNPRNYVNAQRRLRHAQQTLSRRNKDMSHGRGSNRWNRALARVRRIHAHIAAQRADHIGKLTTWLATNYTDISIEDLNVQGMSHNRRLAKHILDADFHEFRRQLEYKTARAGTRLHVIDRWYPSSKTCSRCGTVKAKLPLSERVYHCDKCGLDMDRDLNAAINIMVAGSAPETLNARGGDARRDRRKPAAQTPAKREPSSQNNGMRLGAGPGNEAMQTTTN
ncbi:MULTISPECIES: IS607 family element RNA-guided endonuclease TnpB [Bifidobacterium]|uniref:Transposase n=2 Tax=Bifidobacterium TaxID=1678 RepID=A0A7K1J3Y7_9BIFI|nr:MULTISPECIES: IS607 family element RNA-guided endonuclease TnpB [Bifidobacterium]MUH59175.1 transposase [Bifidobacterium canis]RYQ19495.1 transposase [Bifidobacterium pseudolongum subsp. globosum]